MLCISQLRQNYPTPPRFQVGGLEYWLAELRKVRRTSLMFHVEQIVIKQLSIKEKTANYYLFHGTAR